MAIHIAFEKSADTLLKKLVKILAGPCVHTELIVTQHQPSTIHTAYSAYTRDLLRAAGDALALLPPPVDLPMLGGH